MTGEHVFAAVALSALFVQVSAFSMGNPYNQLSPYRARPLPNYFNTYPTQAFSYGQFSTCFYVNLQNSNNGPRQIPLLSYMAGRTQTPEIAINFDNERQASGLYVGGDQGAFFPSFPTAQWTHVCLTWDGNTGRVNAYYDGQPTGMTQVVRPGYRIPGNGYLTLGQPGMNFGQLTHLQFWNRVITSNEVTRAQGCSFEGNILSWGSSSWKSLESLKKLDTSTLPCGHDGVGSIDSVTSGNRTGGEETSTAATEEYTTQKCVNEPVTTSFLDMSTAFDREDLYVSAETKKNISQVDDGSMCAWVNVLDNSNCYGLMDQLVEKSDGNDGYYNDFGLYVCDSFSALDTGLATHYVFKIKESHWDTKAKIPIGDWQHICLTWKSSSGEGKIYVNGEIRDQGTFEAGIAIRIGIYRLWQRQKASFNVNDPKAGFLTKITAFNVWNYTLTQNEVFDVYCARNSGNVINKETEWENPRPGSSPMNFAG